MNKTINYISIFMIITIIFIYILLVERFNFVIGLLLFYILIFLIPLIVKYLKSKRDTKNLNKEYEVILDFNFNKDEKLKLILFTTILAFLYYFVLKITNNDTILFIILIITNIRYYYYNRKKITLSFETDKILELDNYLLNIKLKRQNIKKIETKENWNIAIYTSEDTLTFSIPYTSLVKERDNELRTELMNEIMKKINNV